MQRQQLLQVSYPDLAYFSCVSSVTCMSNYVQLCRLQLQGMGGLSKHMPAKCQAYRVWYTGACGIPVHVVFR